MGTSPCRVNTMWENVNLSSKDSIRGLIKFRYKFDKILVDGRYSYPDDKIDEEIVCTYVWLDDIIDRCKLTDRQTEMLESHMMGYSEQDIAFMVNVTQQNVNGILNSVCDRIYKYVKLDWKYNFYFQNKARMSWNYKKCSKCKELIPATNDFFGIDSSKSDGLTSACKECRKG